MGVIEHWGSTPAERARRYPCDDVLPDAQQELFRAVTVDAPPSVVYRWLCQLKVAPYSYDLIDNLGRRSPRELTPGAEDLVVGEKVIIFHLASFTVDDHLTLSVLGHRLFGDVAITYAVHPDGADGSRLVAKIATNPRGGLPGAILRRVLPLGDLVMMRRQLLHLKHLSERTAGRTSRRGTG